MVWPIMPRRATRALIVGRRGRQVNEKQPGTASHTGRNLDGKPLTGREEDELIFGQ